MALPQGIKITTSTSLADLEKVTFHEISDGYDRRGRIVTFIFKRFDNYEYQRYQCITTVRALVSFLAPHFQFMDTYEYSYDEQNDCWIFSEMRETDDFRIIVNHKYWTQKQIVAFKKMVLAIAELYDVEVEDKSNY